jgi:CMP-N,N'-diacetyllegionaminic acid synthase
MIIDAIIPARGNSQGLPGKNMRVLVDRPLIMHSIVYGQMSPRIRSVLVSTDDSELAEIARLAGALVPELRPTMLAQATTPMADVIRYASRLLCSSHRTPPDYVALLDPTSPLRELAWLDLATDRFKRRDDAVGVVGISTPSFNPTWVGVDFDKTGVVSRPEASDISYSRRQDVPRFWRISGSLYVWRYDFALSLTVKWLSEGVHLGLETQDLMSASIDSEEDFQMVELLLQSGMVSLPWMA